MRNCSTGFLLIAAAVAASFGPLAWGQASTKNRPTATAAPSPAAKTWDREPTTVFGVLLGGPIPRSSFPACVKPTRENDYARPSETCLQEPEYGYPIAYLKGLGISGVADEASLHLLDEKVVSVHVSFRQQTYGAMKSILIERYGPCLLYTSDAADE